MVTTNAANASGRSAFLNAWVGLPMLWAVLNGIPPYLFIHYAFSGGRSFAAACKVARALSNLLVATALVLVFLSLPVEYDVKGAMGKSMAFMSAQLASRSGVVDVAQIPGERACRCRCLQLNTVPLLLEAPAGGTRADAGFAMAVQAAARSSPAARAGTSPAAQTGR
jgi:hypothetical protein